MKPATKPVMATQPLTVPSRWPGNSASHATVAQAKKAVALKRIDRKHA